MNKIIIIIIKSHSSEVKHPCGGRRFCDEQLHLLTSHGFLYTILSIQPFEKLDGPSVSALSLRLRKISNVGRMDGWVTKNLLSRFVISTAAPSSSSQTTKSLPTKYQNHWMLLISRNLCIFICYLKSITQACLLWTRYSLRSMVEVLLFPFDYATADGFSWRVIDRHRPVPCRAVTCGIMSRYVTVIMWHAESITLYFKSW
jgi:hypothetical protein